MLELNIVPTIEGYETLNVNLHISAELMDEVLSLSTPEEKKARIRKAVILMNDSFQNQWNTAKKNNEADITDIEHLIGVPGTSVVNQAEVNSVVEERTDVHGVIQTMPVIV